MILRVRYMPIFFNCRIPKRRQSPYSAHASFLVHMITSTGVIWKFDMNCIELSAPSLLFP